MGSPVDIDEYKEYSFYGWDGDEASPISAKTIENAKALQKLLATAPSVAPGADGSIGWEWRDGGATLFIDITDDAATIFFSRGFPKAPTP